MQYSLPYIFITVLALVGFILAVYIYRKKRRKEQMVCPLGSDCDAVIHSQYARFLGVPVEALGILYYAIVVLVYIGFSLAFIPYVPLLSIGALVLTSFAFLFSAYLIFIQAFVLRQWCTWCLVSAALCAGIFLAAVSSAILPGITFLEEMQPLLIQLHTVAIAVGVGAATIIEVFFLKFLRDYRLSINESGILNTLAEILWIALAVTLLTQIGIFFGAAVPTITTTIKNIVIFIAIINGAFLHSLLTPKLMRVSLGENHAHAPGELHRLRKLAFNLSAISVTSWYFLVLLSSVFRTEPAGIVRLVGTYVAIFAVTVIVNHIFDLIFSKRPSRHSR